MITFLGIVSYVALTYMIMKRKDEEKKQYFFGFIILINVISIELVNQLSAKPFEESATINYSLFFYPLVLVSVTWAVFYLYKMSKEYIQHLDYKKTIQILFVKIAVLITLCYFLFRNNYEIIHLLGGNPLEKDSKIYQSGWLNSYTNPLYINVYTYNIVIFLSLITASMKSLSIKKEEQLRENALNQNNI